MSLREIDWHLHADTTLDYLCVDAFLTEMVGARALGTAFELGLIDALQEPMSQDALEQRLQLDAQGLSLLFEMLEAHAVLARSALHDGTDVWQITNDFQHALRYRDLLEAKLYFAGLVAHDYLHLATALLMQPQRFFEQARIFSLFAYDKACALEGNNYADTARWMRITTALTTYESAVCLAGFDFSVYRRVLDIGGNSGELMRQVCTAMPRLDATIYDLPLVCDIGRRHVDDQSPVAVSQRVTFVKRDKGQRAYPQGHDLIVFKSMLHDWPAEEARDFLQRAYDALPPGGTLLIFERAHTALCGTQIGYGQLPLMLFFRSYRRPEIYKEWLEQLNFHSVQWQIVPLDMPFMMLTARKEA